MANWTKWVFGGLGWAMGGPIGGVIGFALGSALDSASAAPGKAGSIGSTATGDFAASLLVLCAAVMKSDNKVLRSELDYVKLFFVKQFGTEKAQELILLLREILKQDIPVEEVSRQVALHLDQASRLQLLHMLFGISAVDGEVHADEINTIRNIAIWLGVSSADFESLLAMFKQDNDSAYKILEVDPSASNDEIKKAYRAMAVKHHPDKVQHLGEEFQKDAQEKIKSINAAYEKIKKERGIV